MTVQNAKFFVGQVVKHRLFEYRGVIFDVDSQFQGTEEWYNQMAKSRPPKDKPWYRVLVHGNVYETYVAERNLEPDDSGKPIEHPFVSVLFNRFENGVYHVERSVN
jgi:heat shock protein HspQ